MMQSDGLTVGASWVGVLGEGYGGPKDWITEHNTLDERDPQRKLRQRIYDIARWRAMHLVANENPGGVLSWYEEHLEDLERESPKDRNYRRMSPEERKKKAAELRRELGYLRPIIKDAEPDPDHTAIWPLVNHLTFNILKGMQKYGHPIQPGQNTFDEADVWCAGGDDVPCPIGFPTGLEVDLTPEDYEEHHISRSEYKREQREKAATTGGWERPAAVMPEPGTPEWNDLHARALNALAEVIWLTEYGGQTGDEQAGLEKTTAQSVVGQRNFYWFWRAFSNWVGPFSQAEFMREFARQDGSSMLSIARDMLEFVQTGEWPRLARLRHEMWPGVELYRRTNLTATAAGRRLSDLRKMAGHTAPKVSRSIVRSAAASQQLSEVLPPALANQPAAQIAQASRLVRDELQKFIQSHKHLSADQKRTVRFIESGPLRRVGATSDVPIEGAIFLLYNSRPGLFMKQEEATGLRYYDLMLLLTQFGHRGWRVIPGRRQVTYTVPLDPAQWDDVAAPGPFTNVTFSEIVELPSFGPMLLSTTGPTSFFLDLMRRAQEMARVLTPYGLYAPQRGLFFYDTASIPDPSVIGSGTWTTTVERAIFDALGLSYEMPAQRTKRAPRPSP